MKKKIIMPAAIAALMGIGVSSSPILTSHVDGLSDLQLANAEALAENEPSSGYGCGYAAYEWDNDFWEDTKNFSKCMRGCPEKSGTSPKYIMCD